MEDDSTDKRPRPGSNMDEGDIGMLDEPDRKILSSSIMGVVITEIYSQRGLPKWQGNSA